MTKMITRVAITLASVLGKWAVRNHVLRADNIPMTPF